MSARKQAGQLKSIAARKIKESRINELMADALRQKKNIYTGNLINTILSRDPYRSLRISYSINKELDCIENVSLTYVNDIRGARYGRFIDIATARSISEEPNPSVSAISKWIYGKIQNGTWDNPNGAYYVVSNNYSSRKDPKVKAKGIRGGKSKTYKYPLVGSSKSKKYRNALAYKFVNAINERGELKNKSAFLTAGNLQIEFALLSAIEEFNNIWLNDLSTRVGVTINNIFQ
jgi:hypothetical protein